MMQFPRYSTLAWVNGVLGLLSAALCLVIALPNDAAATCPATRLGSVLHVYIVCPVMGWELLVSAAAAFALAAACVRWTRRER